MARIVVAGAGICGLGTSLLLARDGHEVTRSSATIEPCRAPRAPRGTHGHAKASRNSVSRTISCRGCARCSETELPDVQESLRASGAAKFDLLAALPPFWTDKLSSPDRRQAVDVDRSPADG